MEPTEQNRGPAPGAAAAAAVAPDQETAQLLEKHAAWKSGTGERPTPRELGKLGAFAKFLKNPFGKTGAGPGPAQPGSSPGNAAGVAAVAPDETPGSGLEPVPVDAALAQRVTAAVIGRADAFAVSYIEREARGAAAGLPAADADKIVERFRNAAGLPVADKKLLIEISPDVFQELGWDPHKASLFVAVGVLGMHTVNLWQCVGELREMRKKIVDVKTEVQPQKDPPQKNEPPKPAPAAAADDSQKIVEFPK